MEINKYSDIIGAVATEDIVEGRMVLLTSHSESYDYGSRDDLKGVKLPDTSAEAAKAWYVSAFALDNRSLPIYQPTPSISYSMRAGGFGGAGTANVPFTAKTYLTHPSDMIGQTIPSGELALAFGGGVFTVTSGHFVYSASMDVGTYLVVCNAADDSVATAGMLKHSASATGAVAVVDNIDATNMKLRFRTLQP